MKMTPFLEYILYDVFGESEPITARAMMGSHILYYEGKVFAIVENEELYFKGSKELVDWYLSRGSKQFRVSRSRGLAVNKPEERDAHLYYFLVPQEVYEDKERREEWMEVALSVAKAPKGKSQSN
jgi:TfoX/Sxy family transcriptional regulator of competence genes